MQLVLGHLYPDLMNIYGDIGNITALKKRAEWRKIEVLVKNISLRDKLKEDEVDFLFFGGGQDQAQEMVAEDLVKSGKGKAIREETERGMPLLSICGGYQLLGEYYQPHQSPKLPGVGLFPAYTIASFDRMIGNIIIDAGVFYNHPLLLVGFENHSGKTYLKDQAQALGKVIKGFGNNGKDKTEGCIYKNAIGCYMHGSLLPKNPALADWLLEKALERKYQKKIILRTLDDSLEKKAHDSVISRFK